MSTYSRYFRYTVSAVVFVFITAAVVMSVNQGKIGIVQARVAYIVAGSCWLLGWLL